jgi:hypothetical protein
MYPWPFLFFKFTFSLIPCQDFGLTWKRPILGIINWQFEPKLGLNHVIPWI